MSITNGMKLMSLTNPTISTDPTILEMAMRWYDEGFLPIPFVGGQKRSLVKFSRYLNGTPRPSRSVVKRWFSMKWKVSPQGISLALLCGVGGLVCLDFDLPHLFWLWNCSYPKPFTRITKTPRGGFHVWFKVRDISSLPRPVTGLEFKVRGTVNDCPGHTKDGEYTHFYSPTAMDLPVAEIDQVKDVLCEDLIEDGGHNCNPHEQGNGYGDNCDREQGSVYGVGSPTAHQVQEGRIGEGATATRHCHDIITTDTTIPSPYAASSLAASANPPQRLSLSKSTSKVAAIKSYAGIERLIAEYTTLEVTGPGYLSGRCPFHDDKSPSFWVSVDHQNCGCRAPTCHSKQPGGRAMDIIDFHSRIENISARESIRLLHRRMI